FLHPRIAIRRAGSEATAAVLSLSMMGNGTLALAGGPPFKMTTHGWLHRTWEFSSADGVPVLRFKQCRGGAEVEVLNSGVNAETLSLLLLLGWYVPVLAE